MSEMDTGKFYEEIAATIVNQDEDSAMLLAQQAIDQHLDLLDVIEKGFGGGINEVGRLYDEGEYFLPDLMYGADIMQNAMKILIPHLESGQKKETLGKVLLATIEGDIHSIGKNIVGVMLRANNFEIIDLGADVEIEKIVEAAQKEKVDIIGLSALLTTTMHGQKTVVEKLKALGVREQFKIMLGGAPVTADWTKRCGADGYAGSAIEAVDLAKNLLGKEAD
ncbi:MAG: cobalamin B12-binding domain-containing protein [Promethearchaeota archaeon]